MQIYFKSAPDVAADAKPIDPQPDLQTDNEPAVPANDNGLQWPFVSFPEDWCASS